MGITTINGLLLKKMIIAGANELNSKKQLVDSLNVFPVPDGDTGTNMSLTALAAAREIESNSSLNIGDIAKLAASGSLRGARGNSGVILSQLFRGFSKALEGLEEADADDLKRAVKKGVETAYKAVMKPKEGTILTVASSCMKSIEKSSEETGDIKEILETIIEDANETLSQTTNMLPVLKQAGVVDAGGKGLLCILEGALKIIGYDGEVKINEAISSKPIDFSALSSVENTSITFGYCTEFLINSKNTSEKAIGSLKTYLESIGDSLVVVADDDVIKIHVHTDHPGLAIEKSLLIGSLSGLKIDNMREQHTNKIDFSDSSDNNEIKNSLSEQKEVGFISISSGEGLSKIFKNLGVDEIIEGGQTMNPSTDDILNAIEKINAKSIVVLPNNKNIILAAEQAARLCDDKKVYVVPSKTIPEGIAAIFSYDGSVDNIQMSIDAMSEALKDVKTGLVTYAIRDTSFGEREIVKDDILGILGSDISVVAKNVEEGTKELIDKLLTQDNDMISIYYGADVNEESATKIANYIDEKYPDCEIEVHNGGQPLYYYIISVE